MWLNLHCHLRSLSGYWLVGGTSKEPHLCPKCWRSRRAGTRDRSRKVGGMRKLNSWLTNAYALWRWAGLFMCTLTKDLIHLILRKACGLYHTAPTLEMIKSWPRQSAWWGHSKDAPGPGLIRGHAATGAKIPIGQHWDYGERKEAGASWYCAPLSAVPTGYLSQWCHICGSLKLSLKLFSHI
jgi:hypothetical protein